MSLDERTYICECGHHEDRDIHSAKNMLAIKDLVFQSQVFVPMEHREVTLMEFKAAVAATGSRSAISLDEEVRRCSVFS